MKKNSLIYSSDIVSIGEIPLGGNLPVRLQSMTNTNTLDTDSTVNQIIKIHEAGGEYVRVTAPGIKDAENLKNIKQKLKLQGYKIPLIADIHFNPKAAEIAATIVEKIRINPGNYTDRNTLLKTEFSNKEYLEEIDKIRANIRPLLKICNNHGTVLRIGSNHGSLSKRILNKYGDTPEGMAESAMEFLRICCDENFFNIVVSMKASNTKVMVYATRMLVHKMMQENMRFPVHLGVTEAGSGEDGRIKSSAGIASLLHDGIGDTIRVSLTEAPEKEIPVAKQISKYSSDKVKNNTSYLFSQNSFSISSFNRRKTIAAGGIGALNHPVVVTSSDNANKHKSDFYFVGKSLNKLNIDSSKKYIIHYSLFNNQDNFFPYFTPEEFKENTAHKSSKINFVIASCNDIKNDKINLFETKIPVALILKHSTIRNQRRIFEVLKEKKINVPVIVQRQYNEKNKVQLQLKTSADYGILLTDGFSDGIFIVNKSNTTLSTISETSFAILQATRSRISKTEFISCPTCGRTQYNMESALDEIKKNLSHLKGLKIAVMGCIVNGPGEMADADYGYVGSSGGKVNLYKGNILTQKNVPAENALEELIQLIKQNNEWTDK